MTRKLWMLNCAVMVALAGAIAIAQETAKQESPSEKESKYSPAAAEMRIERTLDRRLRSPLKAVDEPLDLLVKRLAAEHEIPVVLDVWALESMAINADVPINLDLHDVSLRAALNLFLLQTDGLTYMVDHEVLIITTKDRESSRHFLRTYRIDDVWAPSSEEPRKGASAWADFNVFLDAVTSCVVSESWSEYGTGNGEIQIIEPGLMVVSQSYHVHREIAAFLKSIREIKRAIDAHSAKPADASQVAKPFD